MSEVAVQIQNSLAVADKSIHAHLKLYSQQALALQSVSVFGENKSEKGSAASS